ncbi:MAG: SurA N-terminal domain-containing protein [Deltaproteobacteria bacterium]|nr:SurA N-terminal domain-containing protein [Deltaproteobacteria bacterium]
MLLSLMRKHAKSWLIKFLIGIIALVFIFYFGYSFKEKEGVKVAMVNGEVISLLDYQKAYRDLLINLQKEYKSVWSDNLIKVFDLKNRALEGLIDKKLISQEARRIGLDITEKETQDQILSYPAFQFKGGFDEGRYRSLLLQNRMKPEDFERNIAQEMLQNKLRQFLLTFLPVSDQEVLDQYTFSNQQVKISFVQFLPKDFMESIELDPASMEKYFEEQKEEYRIPEKIKISYIRVDPDGFRDQVSLYDQEIQEFYEDNMEMFTEGKEVKARHILFKLELDASDDEVQKIREKALSVLEKARGGEDFAKLAEMYSEGPTKAKGGDLGYFSKGRMVRPFEDAAFKLEKGRISDLVKTVFGYHIIKVEDIKDERTKPLDEVRKQISEILISNGSMDLANEKALSLIDQMPYDMDLAQYAGQHKVPIMHTGYFSQDEPIPEIGGDQKLRESIFSLENKDVSELIEFQSSFFILQVTDKKPSYLPEIKEVSDEVKEDYIEHLTSIEAKSAAEKCLTKLSEGTGWDELIKENNLTPETTDFFNRQDLPPKIGYSPGLQEVVFSLGEDRVYPDKVLENENGSFIVRWDGEKGIDEKKYQEEKEQYRSSLMMAKQQTIFMGWLQSLKEEADIDRSHFKRYR